MRTTTRYKETACPVCGVLSDSASSLEKDVKPKPGDITVCIECRTVLQFNQDFSLRIADQKVVEAYAKQITDLLTYLDKVHAG